MAISDNKLDDFFGKQKVGSTGALKKKGKTKEQEAAPKPNKTVSKPRANREQTVSVPLANREQTVSKPLAESTYTVSKPLANREQTVSKPLAEPLAKSDLEELHPLAVKLHDFSAKERECLKLIFWKCYNNGSLESPPIYTQEITQQLVITSNRTRNVINRILKKGGVRLKDFSAGGRNAYRVFVLSKRLYKAMLAENVDAQLDNNGIKPLAEPLANRIPSSSNYNITTTTKRLPDEWLEIDTEPLNHLGFNENHLIQLQSQTELLPNAVQKSINCFAFDLEKNNKKASIKGSPLNYFMGILRKIGTYNAPENYESPKDRALREMLEREEKQQVKRNEYMKKMRGIEFKKWIDSMTNEELIAIAPTAVQEGRDRLSGMSLGVLYPAFDEAVWSSKRKEISEMLGEEI